MQTFFRIGPRVLSMACFQEQFLFGYFKIMGAGYLIPMLRLQQAAGYKDKKARAAPHFAISASLPIFVYCQKHIGAKRHYEE